MGEAVGPLCLEHQNKMPSGKMKSQEVGEVRRIVWEEFV